jgi:hypothetical protein
MNHWWDSMGKSISDGVKPIGNLPFLLACTIGYVVG